MKKEIKEIEQIKQNLRQAEYIADERIATAVYISTELKKPLLVEGPPGAGKTELGKAISRIKDAEFIRLQCYEGLDATHTIYEWEYSKQMLYVQMLRDKISGIVESAEDLNEALEKLEKYGSSFFSEKFLIKRPLLRAISSNSKSAVFLIDEIDRADEEFEAYLLELLSDWQVSIPEIGTIHAERIPDVVITSNATRELSDALRRRALHLFIDFPSKELELDIIKLKVPGIDDSLAEKIVEFVNELRKIELKKPPSPGETIDWARALMSLGVKELDNEVIRNTLSLLLKHTQDLTRVKKEGLIH